ncbi:ATP-dependent nuclease [Gracilibacillus kekensis]|uniref:Putative ATP-dependent endonuclease of the OLD family n=1 Tax=Gracilibacillus kekensis TaxID=1027249 RepID=A0A1M7Q1X4_9BACI|nr:AAA family ATPase [Gracilibacillus kekensis]SHN24205.1 putative ATP-dependent endonuclease of the OLD family [Gracilibacillus kekensis]
MYLKQLSLSNFRQFGVNENEEPGVTVDFNPNMNVLVGENDSGKTAIIDAIRYLLGSISEDYEKIQEEDFYSKTKDVHSTFFYIEGIFVELSEKEAGAFLEWLSFDAEGNYQLRVSLKVEKKVNDNGKEYLDKKVQAGDKVFETRLNSQAREFLKTTYLKPLRDASSELKPGYRSRLAHILKAHPAFAIDEQSGQDHELVLTMKEANENIEKFFEKEYYHGRSLVSDIEKLLSDFHDVADQSKSRSKFSVSKTDLSSILKRLSLDTEDINLGLGNLNLLFIAAELLLLNTNETEQVIGPQITIIEEIEAHLHTQSQIRLIKYIEEELKKNGINNQYILTSHSSNLAASIDPRNIILMNNLISYPFQEDFTELDDDDYSFLERFLDSTKSNLFFAKGIIFVEGESEMLLLPALANLIGHPLHKNGISIVNVRGTSFERYVKLYSRSELWREGLGRPSIDKPLSIVTDVDVKPWEYYAFEGKEEAIFSINNEEELEQVLCFCSEEYDDIIPEHMGVEYATLKQLAKEFNFVIDEDRKDKIKQIVKKDISPNYISKIEGEKKERLVDKYSQYDANVKTCIAPKWTLEYSIALSVLAPYLLESIQEIRYKQPYVGKKHEIYQDLKTRIHQNPGDPLIAYEIFKPVNDKNVSKAEVAQLLAIKLNDLTGDISLAESLRDEILNDENLNYLVNAIKFSSNIDV